MNFAARCLLAMTLIAILAGAFGITFLAIDQTTPALFFGVVSFSMAIAIPIIDRTLPRRPSR